MKRLYASILVSLVFVTGGCARRSPVLVTLPAHPPSSLVVHGVDLLDVERGRVRRDVDIFVEDGEITDIQPSGAVSIDSGVERVDGRGATALPGLIDMHGHLGSASDPIWVTAIPDAEANMRAYLYCGVTTVLDPADAAGSAFERRRRVRDVGLLGPTIFAAGPILTAPGGHPAALIRGVAPWWIAWYLVARMTRELDDAADARAAVQELRRLDADFVKVAVDRVPLDAPRLDDGLLTEVGRAARLANLRMIAHIGTTEDALDAGRAGAAAWMHGVYKERIPDAEISRLAAFDIPMVVTIEVFASYARLDEGPRVATRLERETVAGDRLAAFDDFPHEDPRTQTFLPFLARLREARPYWLDNVARLRAAGVTVLAGSDTQPGVFPGAGLHRELQHLVDAGLSPAEAIRAATLDSARFLSGSSDPDFGVLAVGKRADIVLVEGDPSRDVSVLSAIRSVILRGVPLLRTPVRAG